MSDLDPTSGGGAERLRVFLESYPGAAPLLEGVDPDAPDIGQLVNNFQVCGFVWDGTTSSTPTFLSGGGGITGDCRTIAEAFVTVARDALGLEATLSDNCGEFFIPGGGSVMGGWEGNVDDGAHWAFTNHYYASVNGVDYDMLFYGAPPASGNWVMKTSEGSIEVDGGAVTYRQFGDWYVYPWKSAGNIPEKNTLDWDRAVEGVGLTKEKLAEMARHDEEAKTQRLESMSDVERAAENMTFEQQINHKDDERFRMLAAKETIRFLNGTEDVLDEFVAAAVQAWTPCTAETFNEKVKLLCPGTNPFNQALDVARYGRWKEAGFPTDVPD